MTTPIITPARMPNTFVRVVRMQWLHLFTVIPYGLAWGHYSEGGNYIDGIYLAAVVHALVFLGTAISCLVPQGLLITSFDLSELQAPCQTGASQVGSSDAWISAHEGPFEFRSHAWRANPYDDDMCINPASGLIMPFGPSGFDTAGNFYGSNFND